MLRRAKIPAVPQRPTGTQGFVFRNDANVERCVDGVKIRFDLVDLVAPGNHDLVHCINGEATHDVFQERPIEHGKKRFWDGGGPRSKA